MSNEMIDEPLHKTVQGMFKTAAFLVGRAESSAEGATSAQELAVDTFVKGLLRRRYELQTERLGVGLHVADEKARLSVSSAHWAGKIVTVSYVWVDGVDTRGVDVSTHGLLIYDRARPDNVTETFRQDFKNGQYAVAWPADASLERIIELRESLIGSIAEKL